MEKMLLIANLNKLKEEEEKLKMHKVRLSSLENIINNYPHSIDENKAKIKEIKNSKFNKDDNDKPKEEEFKMKERDIFRQHKIIPSIIQLGVGIIANFIYFIFMFVTLIITKGMSDKWSIMIVLTPVISIIDIIIQNIMVRKRAHSTIDSEVKKSIVISIIVRISFLFYFL